MKWRSTKKASFSIKIEELAAAWESQGRMDRLLLGIEFQHVVSLPFRLPRRYVVLAESDYLAQQQTLKTYEHLAGALRDALNVFIDEEQMGRIMDEAARLADGATGGEPS